MMDYEKAYKEALERAREFQKSKDGLCVLTAESIFPELKESEDERIRKGLIKALGTIGKRNWGGIDVFESIAWLKKQGEQKPTWSEEDDAYELFAISAVEDYYDEKNPLQKGLVDWLKSLKERIS